MENINKEEILALIDKLHALGAAVEVDLEGQIVVYTGIKIF